MPLRTIDRPAAEQTVLIASTTPEELREQHRSPATGFVPVVR